MGMELDVKEPNATPALLLYPGAFKKIPPLIVDGTEKCEEFLNNMREVNIKFDKAHTIPE